MKAIKTLVTPVMAETWLNERNNKNRRISPVHVNRLANEMVAGRWAMNGETIVFDQDLTLVDGQHRLTAIVRSGVTVEMLVVTGVEDPRAFATTGSLLLRRGANQVAEMMGLKAANINNIVAATRVIMAWDKTETHSDFGKYMANPRFYTFTNEEVSEHAIELQDELKDAFKQYANATKLSGSPSTMIALFSIFNRYDPIAAQSLFGKLADGLFTSKGEPAKLLYDLLNKSRFPIKSKRLYITAITIKAFNATSESKEIGNLRWRTEGAAPEQFPRIKGANKK